MTNGYIFMNILVSDVSVNFTKIMDFLRESSNVPMAVESQNVFFKCFWGVWKWHKENLKTEKNKVSRIINFLKFDSSCYEP